MVSNQKKKIGEKKWKKNTCLKLRFWTISSPYKKCATEKRTYKETKGATFKSLFSSGQYSFCSVLRYGLPADFQAMVLLPKNKAQKKLRDALNKTYAHLEPAGLSGLDHSEYYPYVYHKINIDMYGKSGFST